jgi:hypothetical protein
VPLSTLASGSIAPVPTWLDDALPAIRADMVKLVEAAAGFAGQTLRDGAEFVPRGFALDDTGVTMIVYEPSSNEPADPRVAVDTLVEMLQSVRSEFRAVATVAIVHRRDHGDDAVLIPWSIVTVTGWPCSCRISRPPRQRSSSANT